VHTVGSSVGGRDGSTVLLNPSLSEGIVVLFSFRVQGDTAVVGRWWEVVTEVGINFRTGSGNSSRQFSTTPLNC